MPPKGDSPSTREKGRREGEREMGKTMEILGNSLVKTKNIVKQLQKYENVGKKLGNLEECETYVDKL